MKNMIYGAGVYGEIFAKEIEKSGYLVENFIDQHTQKKSMYNKDIKRLKDIDVSDITIFISITSPHAEQEVLSDLKKLGAKHIFSFVDTLHKFPKLVEKCVSFTKTWYSPDRKKMINENKLALFETLLKDTKSKELLKSVINFREELSAENYLIPDLQTQYFPSDIDLFSSLETIRFVDGGAFIGDTLASSMLEFQKVNKEVEYIISFEPDNANILKLSEEVTLQKQRHPKSNFFIYPCGLWSSNKILQFSNNSNSNSSLINKVSESTISIMTIALDETIIGAIPNYIKMDIEGAEKEAILGAKKIISTQSPVLAICLYHKAEDLWELPLLINDLNPNYDMHLRIYGSMGLELVLYCVPKKCIN